MAATKVNTSLEQRARQSDKFFLSPAHSRLHRQCPGLQICRIGVNISINPSADVTATRGSEDAEDIGNGAEQDITHLHTDI